MDQKVATEAAEADFRRFIEAMELLTDEGDLNAEELETFKGLRKTIVGAVENGSLVFDESGLPRFTPRFGEQKPLSWKMPTGATLMAIDGFKDTQNMHRLHSYIAACCGINAGQLAKIDERDMRVLRAIANLFLVTR